MLCLVVFLHNCLGVRLIDKQSYSIKLINKIFILMKASKEMIFSSV